jgi:hypothetical protein
VINLSLRTVVSRLAALFVSVVTISFVSVGSASAQPEAWNQPEPVSGLDWLLLLVLIPLGVVAVITLLAWLPSLAKSSTASTEITVSTDPQ